MNNFASSSSNHSHSVLFHDIAAECNKKTINVTDTLFVRVKQSEKLLLEICIDGGLRSISDTMAFVRKMLAHCCGLAVVNIRNKSQGWVIDRNLVIGTEVRLPVA